MDNNPEEIRANPQEDERDNIPMIPANDAPVQGEEPRNPPAEYNRAQGLLKLTVAIMLILVVAVIGAVSLSLYNVSNQPSPQHTVYTKWGSNSCNNIKGASLLYSGLMAGQKAEVTQTGQTNENIGGTNSQCMPVDKIEYTLASTSGTQGNNIIYGVEYQSTVNSSSSSSGSHHNVPCAVCMVTGRTAVRMIPATTSCPDSWTNEYFGYLMISDYSTYVCVDAAMESAIGSIDRDYTAAELVHVEASCKGLPCNPYIAGKELNCVVCSI